MSKKLAITVLLLLVGVPVVSAKTANINQEPLHGQLGDTKVEVVIGDTTPDHIVLWSENTAPVTTNPGATSGSGGGGGSSAPTNTVPVADITPVIPIISAPLTPSEVVITPSDTPHARDNAPTTPGQPAVAPPINTESSPISKPIPTTHSSSPAGAQEAPAPATKEPPLSNPLNELRSTIAELQKTVDAITRIQQQAVQNTVHNTPPDLTHHSASRTEPGQTSVNLHGAAPPQTNTLLDWLILLILALSTVIMYNNRNFFLKKIINKNTHDHPQNKN